MAFAVYGMNYIQPFPPEGGATKAFSLFISQQPGQQIVQDRRIDRQVAVSVAAEECISGRMFHHLRNPGVRRVEVERESEQALSRDPAVTWDEQLIERFFAQLAWDVAWIEERSRLTFDINDQRPGHCRFAIAAHQMQSQRFRRGAGDVQGFLKTGGAFQDRLQICFAKRESLRRRRAALTLSKFFDR